MSLVILLVGLIALPRLANRELPDVDSPVVSVTTVYPGAAPEVVETSVTQLLEDELIGIERVRHVTSTSREQVSSISVEFELDQDLEVAANDVRDRVARVRSRLPKEVREPIVAKRDSDAWPILWLALSGRTSNQIQLSRIAETRLKDRIGKLPGVATIMIGGERRYSMRVWIDNARLTAHDLTITDVTEALARENVDIPSGRVESTDREFTVRSLGELKTPEAYEKLIIANVNGDPVRLRDVADVEVGPEDERKVVRFNGVPAVGLGVVKQSKANTLAVAAAVREEMGRIRGELPPGVKLEMAFDSSIFIQQSVEDVTRTIFEAIALVVIVIYLFLRSIRATVIPAVAIPVSIVGTFCVLNMLDYSINTLTLMGLTLAIGLVVDDAIVVLENVTRWIEQGMSRLEATRRGMEEISFAVVAATISAVAVFLPLAFLTDTTGRLFREFGVTVATAILISGFVALTLSPALCARVLRGKVRERGLKALLAWAFERLAAAYAWLLRPALAHPGFWVLLGAIWVGFGVWVLGAGLIDEELIPTADRNGVIARTIGPEGSTIEYQDRYQRQAEEVFLQEDDVLRAFSVVALGIGTPGVVNQGMIFSTLRPREDRERSQSEITRDLGERLAEIPGVEGYAFEPSPLRGFRSQPVSVVLQGTDIFELARFTDEVLARARRIPGLVNLRSDLYLNKPQLEVEIDRDRASDLGVSVRDIATTLQILLGGHDISTFKLEGETYDVIAQLARDARTNPDDLLALYVRGAGDQIVPLVSVVDMRETVAPRAFLHFDRLRAATITGSLAGASQGRVLEQVRAIAEDVLPNERGYAVRFSGEAERYFEAGSALTFAYGLAILIVFLVLAAQFESFIHPLTILVAVALSFTGALVALLATGYTLNVYSKIGLVMLVGLVTKNSILIVEFANQLRARGLGLADAVFQASRIRFRPILMTALATMVGILPIALGLGAGGESRAPLGVAVVGGMLFSTLLTFLVVPATYLSVEQLRARLRKPAPEVASDVAESAM
jgi:multidrug efflux pump